MFSYELATEMSRSRSGRRRQRGEGRVVVRCLMQAKERKRSQKNEEMIINIVANLRTKRSSREENRRGVSSQLEFSLSLGKIW